MSPGFQVRDLGLIPFHEADAVQRTLLAQVRDGQAPNTLLLLEHPPVLTLGANFHPENLLHPTAWYEAQGIQVSPVDRGGDVTFHGPGQLVAYPVFDLSGIGKDLHLWLRNLEECVLRVLAQYGIEGRRFPPHTGVWVGDEKVAAMGVKVSRWVSIHGLALNCNNPLDAFGTIVPCGISGYGVTSLTQVLGRSVTVEEVKPSLVRAFQDVFGLPVL